MDRKLLLVVRGLTIAALALSLGGCGTPRYEVTGQVKYNGEPLAKPNGQIVFVSPDGAQVAAAIGSDGTYKAARVTAGPNKVIVYYPNPAFTKPTRPKGPPSGENRPALTSQFLTPEKYADPNTSGLSVEVARGTAFNVEMTGPAIP